MTRRSRTPSTASWRRGSCCPTPATSPSPPRPRTRRWRSSAKPYPEGGQVKHRPFHSYTMKQAIQEGFILDVLANYTPVRQLLPAGQEGRGRSGVRHQAGPEEAAPLRRRPRLRHPPQGRDHGGSLPRPGHRPEQDRRPGAGHGGDQRHPARHPVLPRHPRLPAGAQKPLPGDRRLLRRARVRRRQGDRGLAQRLLRAA